MILTSEERRGINYLIKDKPSPGMIIWLEEFDDGSTDATGCAQGTPTEVVMMTIQAIDFACRSLNMEPNQVLKKLADYMAETNHKPGEMTYETCNFK